MTPKIIGKFEAIFDRGSFEAIIEKDREAYSEFILKILAPKFRIILNGYEYPPNQHSVDPRNVDREEVFQLFEWKNKDGILAQLFFCYFCMNGTLSMFCRYKLVVPFLDVSKTT